MVWLGRPDIVDAAATADPGGRDPQLRSPTDVTVQGIAHMHHSVRGNPQRLDHVLHSLQG